MGASPEQASSYQPLLLIYKREPGGNEASADVSLRIAHTLISNVVADLFNPPLILHPARRQEGKAADPQVVQSRTAPRLTVSLTAPTGYALPPSRWFLVEPHALQGALPGDPNLWAQHTVGAMLEAFQDTRLSTDVRPSSRVGVFRGGPISPLGAHALQDRLTSAANAQDIARTPTELVEMISRLGNAALDGVSGGTFPKVRIDPSQRAFYAGEHIVHEQVQ